MPKLWNETIESHREAVGEAIFEATAWIIAHEGFSGLSMARVAEKAGIGRATLYKYFSDIDAVLIAWHEGTVAKHLELLDRISASHADPLTVFRHVLIAYGEMQRHRGDHAHTAMLHSLPHIGGAHDHLKERLRVLLAAAAASGTIRNDVPADELAGFALAAVGGARGATSHRAVERIVDLILTGIADEN
jgi:AcrR family transcriptional regulator